MSDTVEPTLLVSRALEVLLASESEPSDTLTSILRLVCESGLAHSAEVSVVDADGIHVRLAAVASVDPETADSLRGLVSDMAIRIDSSLSGRAMRSAEPLVLNSVHDSTVSLPAGVRARLDAFDVRHLVAMRIPGHGGAVGTLLASRTGGAAPFEADEVALLQKVAAIMSLAVERAALLRWVAHQADILDHVGDAIVAIDENRVVTRWNRAAEQLYGIARADALGHPLSDLITTLSHDAVELDDAWSSLHHDEDWRAAVRQVTYDGRVVEVEAFVTALVDDESGFAGAIAVNRDLAGAARVQRQLAEREAFAEAVLDALPGRTAVVGVDGCVRAVNRRYEQEGPFGEGAGSGPRVGSDALAFLDLLAHGTPVIGALAEAVRATLQGRDDVPGSGGDIPGPDERWTAVQVVPFRGPGEGALVSFLDVSERKAHELELAHQATHDALTGLPNRALVLDRLRESLARAHRRATRVAVLFVDLDGLKEVNDTFGHAAGDVLIRTTADRLSASCRVADTVARVGGDEFVVLLDELTDAVEARACAERMLEALRAPLAPDAGVGDHGLTASIGAVVAGGLANPVQRDAEDLVRHADVAMLAAKRSGKDRVVLDTEPGQIRGQARDD